MNGFLTTGKLAVRLGVQEHHIRRLASAGKIPHAMAGVYRVFKESDIPEIRAVCIEAGCLKPALEVSVAASN